MRFIVSICSCLLIAGSPVAAQSFYPAENVPVLKDTKAENRQRLYRSLVNGINKNLSLPLTDSTEENWQDAFYSIELLRYRSPWTEGKLHEAFNGIVKRSGAFQFALMECIYDAYPNVFNKEIELLLDSTQNDKCFAACAEYLWRNKGKDVPVLWQRIMKRINAYPNNPVSKALRLKLLNSRQLLPPLADLLHHPFFNGAKLVFSFQRKNRNYPGLAVVRDSAGNFVKDEYGNIFSVPQLARSITNLPGYISNGNTPQGIFRMKGFDVSKSIFIGPTPNVQLTMPGETSIQVFNNDSAITDSAWTMEFYRDILPASWKTYTPVYESFLAGMCGRTEIIAHGTTVDPSYYKGTTYYPFTPTLGCLCTKEIWDEDTGVRKISDQQKLINAITKAGGPDGYYIVIELSDDEKPVDISELLSYFQ